MNTVIGRGHAEETRKRVADATAIYFCSLESEETGLLKASDLSNTIISMLDIWNVNAETVSDKTMAMETKSKTHSVCPMASLICRLAMSYEVSISDRINAAIEQRAKPALVRGSDKEMRFAVTAWSMFTNIGIQAPQLLCDRLIELLRSSVNIECFDLSKVWRRLLQWLLAKSGVSRCSSINTPLCCISKLGGYEVTRLRAK